MTQDQMMQQQIDVHRRGYIDHLTSEIDRLRAELAKRQWQPIETAPKDGDTNILIGCFGKHWHGEQFIVFYDNDKPKYPWQTPDGISYHQDAPTHWMPLPAPPGKEE